MVMPEVAWHKIWLDHLLFVTLTKTWSPNLSWASFSSSVKQEDQYRSYRWLWELNELMSWRFLMVRIIL